METLKPGTPKILLVNPIFIGSDFETPLGMMTLAAYLKKSGLEVELCDLAFNYGLEFLEERLMESHFDIVGIYAMSTYLPRLVEVTRAIRSRLPDALVVVGGPHATLFPEKLLREYPSVDVAVRGPGEIPFSSLCNAVQDQTTFHDIGNITFRDGEKITANAAQPYVPYFDLIDFPDRDCLPTLKSYMKLFAAVVGEGHQGLNLIASLGCPYNCLYCQPVLRKMHGEKVVYRPHHAVIQEMTALSRKYAIRYFWFEDDTFSANREWLLRFCDELASSGRSFRWSCNTRVDAVDFEVLSAMKRAGCYMIRYGVESGSQIILDCSYHKGTRLRQTGDVVRMTKGLGIKVWAYIMIGGKEESPQTIEETRNLLRRIRPAWIQISMTTPLPGTFYEEILRNDPEVRILSDPSVPITIFDKCMIDTANLSHQEVERIYGQLRSEFPFFNPFRDIRSLPQVLFAHFKYFIHALASAGHTRARVKLLGAYGSLALRAFFIFCRLSALDRRLFATRPYYPPEV